LIFQGVTSFSDEAKTDEVESPIKLHVLKYYYHPFSVKVSSLHQFYLN